jgi:signal transduction histidine kinase
MDAKVRAVTSIAQARVELDRALIEIDNIHVFDPSVIAIVAHALSNYVTVTGATVEMLQRKLADDRDPDVGIWLEGIRHAADLMQHSVGRLVSLAPPADFPLKRDYVNLPVMLERLCHFYRTRTDTGQVHLTCTTDGHVPLVLGDRVALAVVADNMIGYAVRASHARGTVRVQIAGTPGFVQSTIRHTGRGFSAPDLEQLFDAGGDPTDAKVQARLPFVIAREFARRLDGDLWVESEEGRGVSVTVRVPAVE